MHSFTYVSPDQGPPRTEPSSSKPFTLSFTSREPRHWNLWKAGVAVGGLPGARALPH